MLTLIAMFFLGFLFSSCCWACIWLSSLDRKEDEHIQEMEKWYRDNYGRMMTNDDAQSAPQYADDHN